MVRRWIKTAFNPFTRMTDETTNVRIKAKTVIAKSKGSLTRVEYAFRTSKGAWKDNTREYYDNGNSAVVLPYDPARKTVLLTRQLRIPPFIQDGIESMVEACAGKLEDEDPETRILKEIEEELGYRIASAEKLFDLYMSPAGFMERITFFLCRYGPSDKVSGGGGLADEGEDIEVIELELAEARKLVARGEIRDAKTVVLLQALGEPTLAR